MPWLEGLLYFWHGSDLIRSSSDASKVIRKRSDYWQVKVYAGPDPLTGKERYEYDRARTKREAERVEAALKTKVAEGRHRSTAARTIGDLVERWYQWRQGVKEISPRLIAADPGPGERPASTDVLDQLVGGLREQDSDIRAAALVADVRVGESDAARVELEHRDGQAICVLLPYKRRRLRRGVDYGSLEPPRASRAAGPACNCSDVPPSTLS